MRRYNPNGGWSCPKCASGNIRIMQHVEKMTLRVDNTEVKDVLVVTCGTCSYQEIMEPVDAPQD